MKCRAMPLMSVNEVSTLMSWILGRKGFVQVCDSESEKKWVMCKLGLMIIEFMTVMLTSSYLYSNFIRLISKLTEWFISEISMINNGIIKFNGFI